MLETNTAIDGATSGALSGEGHVTFHVPTLELVEGAYKIDLAVHRPERWHPCDYHRQLYSIHVRSGRKEVGIYRPAHTWTCEGGLRITGL